MSDRGERFNWKRRDVTLSQCAYCSHKRTGPRCTAFPDGIPQSILANERDHRKPYPGDHGIQFSPKDDDAAAAVAYMFDDGEGD